VLKRHFNLGTTRLGDVTPAEIQRRLDRLSATPNEQNHAFTIAQIFLRYAVAQGWLDRNPCEGMSLPNRTTPRDRVLADDEIASVWHAAERLGYPFGTIVHLCPLTGQRRSEIGRHRWDYLDPEAGSITLPAAETKNNRQHTFPFGAMAASVVRTIPARRIYSPRAGISHGHAEHGLLFLGQG